MDASTEGRKAEEGGISTYITMDSPPEYNSSNIKKARLQSTLAALLTDPVLADVPKKPSLSDVDTLINLELGSAMRITIRKLDGSSFGTSNFLPDIFTNMLTGSSLKCNKSYSLVSVFHFLGGDEVAMMNSTTVKDLKLAVKKKVNEMESKMGHRHISWKHVWANFCLSYHSEKLLEDRSSLQDYGIRNNSEVQFIPYVVSRASGKRSKSRKHRIFRGLDRKF